MIKSYIQIILFIALGNFVFPHTINSEFIIGDTIVDPIETEIRCGCEFRKNIISNISVHNPNIKNELRGVINGIITFDTIVYDTINSLVIKDFQVKMIKLIDIETNEIIFNKSINQSMNNVEDYEIFCFYRDKLVPIVMNMKCWVEYYNYSYLPINSRRSFYFLFKVISNNNKN